MTGHEHHEHHDHGHYDHDHHHEMSCIDSPEKLKALMQHMHEHNVHHTEELHDVAHALEHQGKPELSERVHHAMDQYEKGNEILEEVLKEL